LGGEADKSPETATENSDALPLVWARDMEAVTDTTDFVEDLLGGGQMSVVYGESNSGKTFWATDLAMHVAAGKAWFEREVETGGVIYVALEGGFGIRNRVAAWKLHHGVSDMAFGVIPTSINMLDPDADTPRLIDSIRGAAKSIDAPIRMVVIDTLSRALAGGNENSSEDLGACVMNADRVRDETGAHVMFIHHSGKDQAKGARGHSLLRAATDTEIEITRDHDAGVSISRVAKQREMEIGGEMAFELETMQLGENKRGKPVTSCVIKSVEAGAKRQKKLRPGSVDAQMMKHIRRMFMEDGIPFKAHPEAGMPLINVVTQDQLRGYLVDAGWLETGNWTGTPYTRAQREEMHGLLGAPAKKQAFEAKNIADPNMSYIDLQSEWLRAPGSGAVTQRVMDALGKLSAKDLKRLDKKDLHRAAGDLHKLYSGQAKKGEVAYGPSSTPVRADLMNMLAIVRDSGLAGLRAALGRKEFVPALAAIGLAPTVYQMSRPEAGT
jgi:hypothetical protein